MTDLLQRCTITVTTIQMEDTEEQSARDTLGRFRDRDDIASIFNCVLAKLVVANVRLGSDSGLYHSQDDTHVVFIGLFIGSFVRHYAKLLTERLFSEKCALC